jgi:uncharacterized membrane protein YgcG
LSRGEKAAAAELFRSRSRVTLKNKNHKIIGAANKALRQRLRAEYETIYFHTNKAYFITGAALSLIVVGLQVLFGKEISGGLFMMVWLAGWSLGCSVLAFMVYHAWRSGPTGSALFLTLFALPFFGGEIFGLVAFGGMVSPMAAVTLVSLVILNIVFYQLLKAPTLAGRRVIDALEGFQLYLSVAEQERLNMLNPPQKTPQLFESFLPYALALGVEQAWSEKFAEELNQARLDNAYQPSWYSGSTPLNQLGSSIGGAFTSAVSSSTSAPGSSSGSGGGGSSGGGGGGGGGGGW